MGIEISLCGKKDKGIIKVLVLSKFTRMGCGSTERKEINQVGAGKAGVHLFHFEQSR